MKVTPNVTYAGRSFNCGIGVLQGVLKDVSIFHSFQPVGVFPLDKNYVSSLKMNANKYTCGEHPVGTEQ